MRGGRWGGGGVEPTRVRRHHSNIWRKKREEGVMKM